VSGSVGSETAARLDLLRRQYQDLRTQHDVLFENSRSKLDTLRAQLGYSATGTDAPVHTYPASYPGPGLPASSPALQVTPGVLPHELRQPSARDSSQVLGPVVNASDPAPRFVSATSLSPAPVAQSAYSHASLSQPSSWNAAAGFSLDPPPGSAPKSPVAQDVMLRTLVDMQRRVLFLLPLLLLWC
jgi:hypothetical protein